MLRTFFIMLMLMISSCQHDQLSGYNKIKKGMGKEEVLQLAGPPKTKSRKNSVDRWLYEFKPQTINETTKEVQFRKGKVIYKGTPITPSELDTEKSKEEAKLEASKSEAFLKAEVERNSKINSEVRARGYSNDLPDDIKKLNADNYKRLNDELEVGEIVAPTIKPEEPKPTQPTGSLPIIPNPQPVIQPPPTSGGVGN